jgi:ribosomal protein S18 acetylase RimI-like enzyme
MDLMEKKAEWSAEAVISVEAATEGDLRKIIAIHKAAFPEFFLTMLGDRFLYELYLGFLKGTGSILLVASQNGKQVGFVVGTTEPHGFFKRLLISRWYAFVFAGFPRILRHTLQIMRRFAAAITYRGEKPEGLEKAALLSSIGILPQYSGRGVGRTLVDRFCQEAFSRGAKHVYLLTDRFNNEAANHFYVKCGFLLESSFMRSGGREMNRYIRTQEMQLTNVPK